MTYTFKIEFSKLFETLEYEFEKSEQLYTKILKVHKWVTLPSATKYKEIDLAIVFEPEFKVKKGNKLTLTIWFRPETLTYYIAFAEKFGSRIKISTTHFKSKDYSKILQLIKKHEPK